MLEEDRTMKPIACGTLVGVLVATLGTASAQPVAPYGGWSPDGGPPGGPPGFVAPMRLAVDSRMERDVYLIAIRYAGVAPEDVKVVQDGRQLTVSVERRGETQGAMGRSVGQSRIARSVSLPPDADFARAQRQEVPGLITYVVPRRFGPWR
jgi:HSP20 family molecular chaperone IbpA